MRRTGVSSAASAFFLACASVLTLAACATQDGERAKAAPAIASSSPMGVPPGAFPHSGAAIATMSEQYDRPRAGAVAGTGASAWVAPPPLPAFVLSGPLPQADAPAPPPAAVANRQPSPPPPAPAAPPPAPAKPAQAPATRVDLAQGRALFNDWSCGTCHALADAGASGAIGPSLDGNASATAQSIAAIVTHGQGAMPGFGGQLSDEEIAILSAYIVAARK